METLWFWILGVMLSVYVVLDGFDLGAGILHQFVAKTDEERRTVIASIGPVWDGNEVWLLASGGMLVFAFPKAYAAGFSGFYMPLMMVLWLLVLRGISIEFRSKEENTLWRSFFDGVFSFSSILLAIVLGAALGNILRGVPLMKSGYFSGPLFTNFRMGPTPGILDWYTVLVGLLTFFILAGHGALYLNWKTAGPVQARSRAAAQRLWLVVIALALLATYFTSIVNTSLYPTVLSRPYAWPLLLLIVGGLAGVFINLKRGRELPAFLSSVAYIIGMLASTAAGVYPNLLVSTLDPAYNLTVFNAASGPLSQAVGLKWWIPAILLALGYFTYLFYSFRGKVTAEDTYGH